MEKPARAPQEKDPILFSTLTNIVNVHHEGCDRTLDEAINMSLTQAVKSSIELNKESAVTLILKVKPSRDREVVILPEVAVKIPKPLQLPTPMFHDRQGRLFSSDPKQKTFDNVVPFASQED